jgi:hypothetical protein
MGFLILGLFFILLFMVSSGLSWALRIFWLLFGLFYVYLYRVRNQSPFITMDQHSMKISQYKRQGELTLPFDQIREVVVEENSVGIYGFNDEIVAIRFREIRSKELEQFVQAMEDLSRYVGKQK